MFREKIDFNQPDLVNIGSQLLDGLEVLRRQSLLRPEPETDVDREEIAEFDSALNSLLSLKPEKLGDICYLMYKLGEALTKNNLDLSRSTFELLLERYSGYVKELRTFRPLLMALGGCTFLGYYNFTCTSMLIQTFEHTNAVIQSSESLRPIYDAYFKS
jgi:hypothetical protein